MRRSTLALTVALATTSSVVLAGKGPLEPGDQGYKNPESFGSKLHEAHAGQVLFSSAPLGKDADESTIYKGSYELGAPLFGRYYARESANNILPGCSDDRQVRIVYSVNGDADGAPFHNWWHLIDSTVNDADYDARLLGSLTNKLALGFTTQPAWSLDASERADAEDAAVRTFNSSVIPMLDEGKNKLEVVVTLACGRADIDGTEIARGSLEIEVKPGAKKAYLAKFGPKLPPSTFKGAAKLYPEIVKALKADSEWSSEEVRGAVVLGDDWEPVRHEVTGKVIAKDMSALVIVHARKETNPEACRIFTLSFRKDAAGGALYRDGTGDSQMFPCSAAPKAK